MRIIYYIVTCIFAGGCGLQIAAQEEAQLTYQELEQVCKKLTSTLEEMTTQGERIQTVYQEWESERQQKNERIAQLEAEKASLQSQLPDLLAQARETHDCLNTLEQARGTSSSLTRDEGAQDSQRNDQHTDQNNHMSNVKAKLHYAQSLRGFFMHKKGIPLFIGLFVLYHAYERGFVSWILQKRWKKALKTFTKQCFSV